MTVTNIIMFVVFTWVLVGVGSLAQWPFNFNNTLKAIPAAIFFSFILVIAWNIL